MPAIIPAEFWPAFSLEFHLEETGIPPEFQPEFQRNAGNNSSGFHLESTRNPPGIPDKSVPECRWDSAGIPGLFLLGLLLIPEHLKFQFMAIKYMYNNSHCVSLKTIWHMASQQIISKGLIKMGKVAKQWMGIATLTFSMEIQWDHVH